MDQSSSEAFTTGCLGWGVASLLWLVSTIGAYFSSFIITLVVLINLSLLNRYIKIKFGKRVKPDGRKALLITGATSGIGLALAKYFHQLGFSVFASYYNEKEIGFDELTSISSKSLDGNSKQAKLFLIPMNVQSEPSILKAKLMIEELCAKHDLELYCLINNAGLSSDGPLGITDLQSMKAVLETNLVGLMMVTKCFLFTLVKNKGRVVNVSSILQYYPYSLFTIYGCTKSGVAYFSDALHRDIRRYGAASICVLPGNLIANTNIIYTRLRCLNKCVSNLTVDERSFYAESIENFRKSIYGLMKAALRESGEDPAKISETYGVELPESVLRSLQPNSDRNPKKQLSFLATLIKSAFGGGVKGTKLETNGILAAYDDAVTLVEPQRRHHAGANSFRNYFGPMLDYLSYFEISFIIEFLIVRNVLE